MATTVDWANKIILVPRADLTLIQSVPTEIRQLDLDVFRLDLKALEAGSEGMTFLDTHSHNPPVTVGGVTLARVIEIINGYTVTFEDGQYAVNLTNANSNVGDVTNVNQVSIRSANSAGLTDVEINRKLSYQNIVWLTDDSDATNGILYPIGTKSNPVNNIPDALTILEKNNLGEIHAAGTWNFDSSHNINGIGISGSLSHSFINIGSGTPSDGTIFSKINIDGCGIGRSLYQSCIFGNMTAFNGDAFLCGFRGKIIFEESSGKTILVDCYSGIAGDSAPEIDFGLNTEIELSLRRYCGGLRFSNLVYPDDTITAEFVAGKLRISPSCESGVISARGLVKIYDSSQVGCIVDKSASIGNLASGIDVSAIEDKLDLIIAEKLSKIEFLALK